MSTWAVVNLYFFLLFDRFRLLGFYEWKSKGFGCIWMIFQYFCKTFVPKSEGPPLNLENLGVFIRQKAFLTLSQTSPGFYVSAVQVLRKHCGKRRKCSGADPGFLQRGFNSVNLKCSYTDPKHKSVAIELEVHHFSTS